MKTLAGNWKLNKNRIQSQDFFKKLDSAILNEQNRKGHKFIIATSDLLLETAKAAATSLPIEIY
jgi:triosephosphate isomerase